MSLLGFHVDIKDEVDLRRVHLLAPKDQPAQLKADLAVVDHQGGLTYTYQNELSAHATHTLPLSLRVYLQTTPLTLRAPLYGLPNAKGGGGSKGQNIRSTKAMNLPVRPPTFPKALDTFLAAPAIAGPAAEVTRDRPSVALALYSAAVFLAPSAVCFACWEAVLSNRRAATLRITLVRRISGRARAEDIVGEGGGVGGGGGGWRRAGFEIPSSPESSTGPRVERQGRKTQKKKERPVTKKLEVEPLRGGFRADRLVGLRLGRRGFR